MQDNEWLHELDADWIENLATRARFLARLHEADEGGFIEVSHVHLTVPPAIAVYLYARRAGNGDTADFVRSIGSNPRVPLSLRAELSPLLLFVGRYASLADQPSPFYGDVNVFGKVVREMPPGEVYIDSETLATYGPAFQWAPTSILRKVKIDQRSLLRDLMADVTVMAPGAVVIPLAIYK